MALPRENLDEQVRRNESTRGSFDDFAGHRARVMQLLLSAAESPDSKPDLVLLGAGNCNDVDLRQLLSKYDQIHLVDWDRAALNEAKERQNLGGDARVNLIAPIDLSDHSSNGAAGLSAAIGRSSQRVVASLCLLSQLIDSAAKRPFNSPSELVSRIESVRRVHLRQMVELLPQGGVGFLVFDFASSQTAPELASASEAQLPAVVGRLLQTGNFFQGLHPGAIAQLLRTDEWFANRISCQNPTPPWNWKVGTRVYAVSAFAMRRKTAEIGTLEK
jgi:hypothetical protein